MTCQVVWMFVVRSVATRSQDGKASVEAANKCNLAQLTKTVKTSGIKKKKKNIKERRDSSKQIHPDTSREGQRCRGRGQPKT